MEFRILGALEVLDDGRPVRLREGRERALLALLLLHANEVVSSDRLVEELWHDEPMATSSKMLQKYVSQLRTALGDRGSADARRLVTHGQGYAFRVAEDELDAERFERLLGAGRRARGEGAPEAAGLLREAIRLWRGPALAEFVDQAFARGPIARLEEMRIAALEELVDADLDGGRHAEVIGELETLVHEQPLREHLRAQLMLALYRSDRQADALRVYRETQRLFRDELGLDPSPELDRLQRAILVHDASLDWTPPEAMLIHGPAAGEAPYRGLEYFDVDEAAWFFGRERLTARLVERVRGARLLAIVGASGSGKSSLVRAGLVAALTTERDAAGSVIVMTPTAHPLESLALALRGPGTSFRTTAGLVDDLATEPRTLHLVASHIAAGARNTSRRRVLVVIDQFEELFSQCRDERERSAFVANIMHAVDADGPTRIVLTLRADFYAHLSAYADLRGAVAREQEYIGPMDADELRRTITGPADHGGWELGPGLVDVILQDLEGSPGALPLLSHALLETWHRRRGRDLTVEGYVEAGGVRKAIARTADRLFLEELDTDERRIARGLLLRLTELGDGTADTRRRVALRELIPSAPPEANAAATRVLNRLTEARLVTTGEHTAEVAHEALIREWPTLHGWLSEDRDGLRMHRQITDAADQWELMARDPGALYRGVRLERALEWVAGNPDALNDLEAGFLAASEAQASLERQQQDASLRREVEAAERLAEAERRRAMQEAASASRLRRRAVALTAALGLAGALGVVSFGLGVQARTSLAIADSQRLGAEANGILQRGESQELAALLAIRGINAQYTAQADGALQRAARQQFSDRIVTLPQRVDGFAVSGDGRQLIAGVGDGQAYVVDTADGSVIRTLPGTRSYIPDADFSPDGAVATTIDDRIHAWDLATGAERWSIEAGAQDLSFSPDGTGIWTLVDGKVAMLDAADGTVLKALPIEEPSAVFLAPDGETAVVTSGRSATTWTPDGGQLGTFEGHEAGIAHVAFSPDGQLISTSSSDKTVRIWDLASGRTLHSLTGHSEIVFQSAFSSDGGALLTGSLDGTAKLWDVRTGELLRTLAGHTGSVYAVAFSADGTHALTTGKDGTVRFWDVAAPVERDTLSGPTSFMYALAFSPDGSRLFAGNADGTAQLWDLRTQTISHVLIDDARVDAAAFSPDGRSLQTAAEGRPAEVWDVETGTLRWSLEGSGGPQATGFSADGTVLLASAGENKVGVWDVASKTVTRTFDVPSRSSSILSPDGTRMFTFEDEAVAPNGSLWDTRTGERLMEVEQPLGILWAAFSPDGRTILTTGRDNLGRLWATATGRLLRELRGHTNIMWRGVFSTDGRSVFTTSQDKSARMWDVATGEQLRYFPGHALSAVAGIAVSPDGQQVAIGSYDGTVQLTPVDAGALIASVCDRLRRDLDEVERSIYGIADERPTCP